MNRVPRVGIAVTAAVTLCGARAGAQAGGGVPWFGFGPVDTAYAMTIDTTLAVTGRWSMLLQSLPGATRATWMATQQIVDARAYRNKRVRIRAWLRGHQATWATLWIAVEGFTGNRPATLLADSLVAPLQGTKVGKSGLQAEPIRCLTGIATFPGRGPGSSGFQFRRHEVSGN